MPELAPGIAVVLFGCLSALIWGTSDFGGGLLARRAPLFGVVVAMQAVGICASLALMVLRGEPAPAGRDIVAAAVAGSVGVVGLTSIYRGLSVGRMGVVAPLAGVVGAVIPVCFGFLRDGVPGPAVGTGIVVALLAVVLVTRSPGHDNRPTGAKWGLLSGVASGLFNVAIGSLSHAGVFGPIAIIRIVQVCILVGVIVVWRLPWRVGRNDLPRLAGIGVLDISGNAAFILATQTGALAVAAVLSSLYPITTVVLAIVVLRERLTRSHVLGIMLTAVAIILIGAGTAAH